jgi:hypothetical protein
MGEQLPAGSRRKPALVSQLPGTGVTEPEYAPPF